MTTKISKKNLTAYWGIEFDTESEKILATVGNAAIASVEATQVDASAASTTDSGIDTVQVAVESKLVPLKKCHSTLLYVGKKENEDEKVFLDFESKACLVTIDAFGLSKDALAFRVDTIKTDETVAHIVPTFAKQQHITFALRQGVAAKDSVLTLLGQGTITLLNEPIILKGRVKRFLY